MRVIYFYADKSVSTVPRSRCSLRGTFEAGEEADVSWKMAKGEKETYVGVIIKTAKKEEKPQIEKFTEDVGLLVVDMIKRGENVKSQLPELLKNNLPAPAPTAASAPGKRARKMTKVMEDGKKQAEDDGETKDKKRKKTHIDPLAEKKKKNKKKNGEKNKEPSQKQELAEGAKDASLEIYSSFRQVFGAQLDLTSETHQPPETSTPVTPIQETTPIHQTSIRETPISETGGVVLRAVEETLGMPFDEEEEEPRSYLELLGTNDHPLEEPAASPDPIALYSGFSELDKLREENRLLKAEVESLRSQLTSSRRQPGELENIKNDFAILYSGFIIFHRAPATLKKSLF
ncbi:uncharacterized protein LOC125573777 [Nematostella vectensis]|uniref:uncharacterized protein LOC125573777 n=1 Tax=Nematostella vectensis TaxID=45351 RepID=UPI00207742AF|nr:uncharacterized protein LOC125573777 [Nematostella vectensis]